MCRCDVLQQRAAAAPLSSACVHDRSRGYTVLYEYMRRRQDLAAPRPPPPAPGRAPPPSASPSSAAACRVRYPTAAYAAAQRLLVPHRYKWHRRARPLFTVRTHMSAGPVFAHVAPDGTRTEYSAADSALIAAAWQRGDDRVQLNHVHLPNGKTLRFEVRFQRPQPASSQLHATQVNLDSNNIRAVVEVQTVAAPAPAAAAAVAPVGAPVPTAAVASALPISALDPTPPVQPPPLPSALPAVPSPAGGASAPPPPSYVHVAPDGTRADFPAVDCALIAAARQRGDDRVRITDVQLPNGKTLRFEVQFGALSQGYGSGMVQVNLDSGNVRTVEEKLLVVVAPSPPAQALLPGQGGQGAAAAAKMLEERRRNLEELVQTEVRYVEKLRMMHDHYYQPLVKVLQPRTMETLFGSFGRPGGLFEMQVGFQTELSARFQRSQAANAAAAAASTQMAASSAVSGDDTVIDLLEHFVSFVRNTYDSYVRGYKPATELLKHLETVLMSCCWFVFCRISGAVGMFIGCCVTRC
jgi:hypothetical protein